MGCLRNGSIFLMLTCISLGCLNADDKRRSLLYEVTGEVFVNGELVDNGAITLDPIDGKGGVYSSQIQAGKYSMQASAGKKRVSITASRPSDKLGPDGKPMSKQYLPPRFNAKTKLAAEIKSSGKNFFEFKLEVDKLK